MPNDEHMYDSAPHSAREPATQVALPRRDEGPLEPTPELLERMNAEFAVVNHGGVRIAQEERDPITGLRRLVFMQKTDFENFYDKPLVLARPGRRNGTVGLGRWWFEHIERRQYPSVRFMPGQPREVIAHGTRILNSWLGWGVEPAPGDWSLIQELMRDVVSAGDEEFYRYLLRWCARMFQAPDEPAEVAIVMRGEKGTGKGTLFRTMQAAVGANGALALSSHGQLTGRFSGHLEEAILVFADEAYQSGNRDAEGTLKALITEPTKLFEAKYQEARMGRNRLHVLMASNEHWVIPAGKRDERRYAVTDVSPAPRDRKWWQALHAQVEGGGPAAMLHDLLRLDLGGWHPRQDVPQTRALLEQKLAGLSPIDAWWHERLQDSSLPFGTEGDWTAGPVKAPKDALRRDFVNWCKDQRRKADADVWFTRGTRKLFPGLVNTEARLRDRSRAFALARRGKMRAAFEDAVGHAMEWPEAYLD